jgi:DNA-binding SARP family transcriptional activator/WD40 repeat protein
MRSTGVRSVSDGGGRTVEAADNSGRNQTSGSASQHEKPQYHARMLIGVLGSLIARGDDGRVATLSGPARCQLLAALVARGGRSVPVSTLVEDLWGEAPPRSAVKTLQSHVVRLRRDLSALAGPRDVIVTDGVGYRLSVSSVTIDSDCFHRDLQHGTQALASGDAEAAYRHLDAALAWWRGEAYAEFPDAPFARAERLRLAELRAVAFERRFEAALRLGRGASLVGEIESRLVLDPYRERLWEQLMVALYRAGRQADALAAYHRVRAVLVDGLGVEPGPDLQRMEQRVLAHDESLRAGHGQVDIAGAPPEQPSADTVPVCPYLGLTGYDESDSALFTAREHVTARLLGRLLATRLLVVTGDSGVGKSSIVRAGLLPAIRAGGLPGSADWSCSVIRPRQLSKAAGDAPVDLLVVDQAEELFVLDETGLSPSEADAVMMRMLDRGVRVVLVLRADSYGRLGELPRLADRVGMATELIAPLTEEELRQVIIEPARRVGLEIEPELVSEALADVRGQSGALPMLSAALLRTWQKRRGSTLSLTAYNESGGVQGALEATAEDAYLSLSAAGCLEARRLLARMATRHGGVWSRRSLLRDTVVDGAVPLVSAATLQALTAGRIVTVSAQHVELVHEALLEHWPRLRAWLDERSAVSDLVEWLGNAARAWESGGREDSDLARGPRLQAALDWQAENLDDVAPLEHEFIANSNLAAQGELLAARERADREAKGRRRLRYIVALLAVVTAVAGIGVGVAMRERSAEQHAALSADARRVAALSLTALDSRTSLLLAASAYRLQPSSDTGGALLSALQRAGTAMWSIALPGRAEFVDVDGLSRYLWTMDQTQTVYRYDLATRRVASSFPARADQIAALSPDGRRLVVASKSNYFDVAGEGRISVLDAADGSTVSVLPVSSVTSGAVPHEAVFTADGRWLAVVEGAQANGLVPTSTLAIFDAGDYNLPPRLLHLDAPVRQLAAGRDTLAVVTATGTVEIVRAADFAVVERGRRPELAESNPAAIASFSFALSPDAHHVALTEPGDRALPLLLDTHHLNESARTLAQLEAPVVSMSFSRSGQLLAASAADGAVTVFRGSDGAVAVRPLGAAPGQATYLAWSGTSQADTELYAAGKNARLVALDPHAGPRLVRTQGSPLRGLTGIFRYGTRVVALEPPTTTSGRNLLPVRVTDLDSGSSTVTPLAVDPAESVQYYSVDASGQRMLLVTQGPDAIMQSNLFELPSGRLLNRFMATGVPSIHNTDVGVIAPDGHTAVYAVAEHRLATFSLPDGKQLRSFDIDFAGPAADRHWLMPMDFAPDGRVLVMGYDTVHRQLPPPGSGPLPSADSSESVPEDQLVGIVNLQTGRLNGQVGGFGSLGIPSATAWSPDGSRVVIGTAAGTIRVAAARDLTPISATAAAVSGNVTSVSFAPDGETVVSGGDDGTMAFWDGRTLRPIGSPIRSVRSGQWLTWFRGDGSVTGYTPGADDDTEIWFTMPARPEEWLSSACALAGTPLTPAEWDRYVGGGRAYQKVC